MKLKRLCIGIPILCAATLTTWLLMYCLLVASGLFWYLANKGKLDGLKLHHLEFLAGARAKPVHNKTFQYIIPVEFPMSENSRSVWVMVDYRDIVINSIPGESYWMP